MPGIEGFEFPEKLEIAEGATSTYAKIIAEPWVHGFGNTIGNALRRVLLSSMEGVAVSSIRIDGVSHEFCSIPDVIEDVMDIVLNIKKLKFKCSSDEFPRTLELIHEEAGEVTGRDIREDGVTEVLNKDQVICTLDKARPFHMFLEIDRGRGYRPSELNKRDDQALGTIPVDCLFSPVERVSYNVQATRVGQHTDYDRLELCVWTDGRIEPVTAVQLSAEILMKHLEVFAGPITPNGPALEKTDPEAAGEVFTEEENKLIDELCQKVDDLPLSVRAKNVLQALQVETLYDLAVKQEDDLSGHRNCGRKTVQEITQRLTDSGIEIGKALPEKIQRAVEARLAEGRNKDNKGE